MGGDFTGSAALVAASDAASSAARLAPPLPLPRSLSVSLSASDVRATPSSPSRESPSLGEELSPSSPAPPAAGPASPLIPVEGEIITIASLYELAGSLQGRWVGEEWVRSGKEELEEKQRNALVP
jgi:hypothetical protein